MEEKTTERVCPECGSTKVSRAGYALRKGGRVQSYKCTICGHTFTEKKNKKEIVMPTQTEIETDKFGEMGTTI